MTNQLTVYSNVADPLEFIQGFGKTIAKSRIFGCESEEQGMVLAMTCLARQCDPLTLAETYDIIQGKLSMKADAMLAGFEESGGDYEILQYDPDGCEITFTRGKKKPLTLKITWEQAQLESWPYGKPDKKGNKQFKPNWATPIGRQDMLFARVVSRGVRRVTPGVVCGRYTPEEISDMDDGGEVTGPPVRATKSTQPVNSKTATSTVANSTAETPSDEVTDVEFKPAEQSKAVEATDNSGRTEEHTSEPSSEEHRTKILSLMGVLKQEGIEDIGARVSNKLKDAGIENGLRGLTIREAESLIGALQNREIQIWVDSVLVGHDGKTDQESNQGNG